jgi:hypothetical protein
MRIAGLPFPVNVHGDPRAGTPAMLRVEIGDPIETERFDQLRCVVAWFAQLGELGALGGTALPPGWSRASLPTGEPEARNNNPVWKFDALAVDPASLTILANAIFATGLPVKAVSVQAQGPTDPKAISCDTYPERPAAIPFKVEENRTQRNVQVTVDFGADVPEPHDDLLDPIRVWCLLAGLGGFREPGPLRGPLDLLPDGDPEIVLDQLTFSIRDNGVHEAAYDVLVSLFLACVRKKLPVAAVTIG